MTYNAELVNQQIGEYEVEEALKSDRQWSEEVLQVLAEIMERNKDLQVSVNVLEPNLYDPKKIDIDSLNDNEKFQYGLLIEMLNFWSETIPQGYKTLYYVDSKTSRVATIERIVRGAGENGEDLIIDVIIDRNLYEDDDGRYESLLNEIESELVERLGLSGGDHLKTITIPAGSSHPFDPVEDDEVNTQNDIFGHR